MVLRSLEMRTGKERSAHVENKQNTRTLTVQEGASSGVSVTYQPAAQWGEGEQNGSRWIFVLSVSV